MKIEYNTSGRNLDALVREHDNKLQIPALSLPHHKEVNMIHGLCREPEYCDGYKLKHSKHPDTHAYVTGVTCEDTTCRGDLTLAGDTVPSKTITFSMEHHAEPKHANTCHEDVYAGISNVVLEPLNR